MSQSSTTPSPILDALTLVQVDENHWRAHSVANEKRAVVFGGQLMAQIIVAATAAQPGKQVRSLHAVFSRAGNAAEPIDYEVSTLHGGRSLGTVSVTASQGDRVICPGLVLMDVGEADVIRHQDQMPDVAGPEQLSAPDMMVEAGTEIRIVDAVDLRSTEVTGPAELGVWVRFDRGGGDDQTLHRALLSWWTDPFLIGTAMRPHDGVGQSQAHVTLSTGVLTQTLTFHEDVDATQWHLLAVGSNYAGQGRSYGTGNVFTRDGNLVASFSQENMIRAMRQDPATRSAAHVM